MTSIGRISASAISGLVENTAALVSMNLDFSLIKIEAPKEFQPLGKALSTLRKTNAETGPVHRTARKLDALLHDLVAPSPKLFQAYGKRVSDISDSPINNPRGSPSHGVFQSQVGADGTVIWAAATSGETAIAVSLLASIIARVFNAPEATAIWAQLVEERRSQIRTRYEKGEAVNWSCVAAADQEISRTELAEWDAGARSWLRIADRARRHEKELLEEMMMQLMLPVDHDLDVLTGVVRTWKIAMATMENLLQGLDQQCQSSTVGAVLLGISAWHVYPDICFGAKEIRLKDQLMRRSGRLTVGLEPHPDKTDGVYWSLSLSHLRYYGEPMIVRSGVQDTSRVSFDELTVVVLGAVLSTWVGRSTCRLISAASLITSLCGTLEAAATEHSEETKGHRNIAREFITGSCNWLSLLSHAAHGVEDLSATGSSHSAETFEIQRKKKLLSLGARRGRKFLGPLDSVPAKLFGLANSDSLFSLSKGVEHSIDALRRLLSSRGLDKSVIVIRYTHSLSGDIEYTTAFPQFRASTKRNRDGHESHYASHIRWTSRMSPAVLPCQDSTECAAYDNSCVKLSEDKKSLSWFNPPSALCPTHFSPATENTAGTVGAGNASMSQDDSTEHISSLGETTGFVMPRDDSMPDILSLGETIDFVIDYEKWSVERTVTYQYLLGDVDSAAAYIWHEPSIEENIASQLNSDLELEEVICIMRQNMVDAAKLISYLQGDWHDAEPQLCRSLQALASAQSVYKLLPEASIALKVIDKPLGVAHWFPKIPHDRFHSTTLTLAQSFACVIMFETGSLDMTEDDLSGVMAVSTGNSIFAAAPLLCDPSETPESYEIKHLIGNLGRAAITLLIPPGAPRIRKPELDRFMEINHLPFDGRREDYFNDTSLHLSFTGYQQPVMGIASHGAQYTDAFYLEALISVYDGRRQWVGDLDVLLALRNDRFIRALPSPACHHTQSRDQPFSAISIDSWDELLEQPESTAILRAHGNSGARLAAVVIGVQNGHPVVVLPPGMCYACVAEAFRSYLVDALPQPPVFIL